MKVSASLIKSFMNCPRSGKFRYVDRLPELQNAAASFGSAVHLALELYNTTFDVEQAKAAFLTIWNNPAEYGIEPQVYPPRTSFSQYKERGLLFIQNYHENNQWVDKEIIATEHRFCVNLGEHQISGIVDILETLKGSTELLVVDLKTGQRPNARNLGFDVQFTSYLYAVTQREFWCGYEPEIEKYSGFENGEELYERFKDYTHTGVWYDLKNAKEYPVAPRTEDDYQKLARCIDEIAKAIEHDVFVPNISGDTCGICSFTDLCPVYSPPTGKAQDGQF